ATGVVRVECRSTDASSPRDAAPPPGRPLLRGGRCAGARGPRSRRAARGLHGADGSGGRQALVHGAARARVQPRPGRERGRRARRPRRRHGGSVRPETPANHARPARARPVPGALARRVGGLPRHRGGFRVPAGAVIRAVFFDAGNTLVRMNYAAIAVELAAHGVRATPHEVQRAEWRARVRLDDEVFAPASGAASTESGSSAGRYVRLILGARGAPREAVYVGDLYSVDVRGARAAGLDAVLLDPAGLWGARDCRSAPDVLAAVRLILDSR